MNQERRLQRLIAPGSIGGIATALAGGVVRVEPQGMPRRAGRIRRLRVGDTEEEVGESEAPPRMTGGEDEALDLHQDTLEYLDLDMVAEGEAMLEQGPSAARRSGGRGATRRRSARRTVVGVTRDREEAGPSSLVVGEEAVEEEWQVAMRPPPYEEEEDDSRSIWSVNVSHQVVRSIRSSMAVGMRGGPAAMAGRLHLSNDQEAESPRIDR